MNTAIDIIQDARSAASILSPVRRDVLEALRTQGSSSSVAAELGLPRQKVNYHVRALEESGLLEHVEDRRKGNCTERIVRATARHYLIAPSVLGGLAPSPDVTRDRFSSANLAAVAARTVSEVAELRSRASKAGKQLPTVSLESAVRFASPAVQAAFVEDLSNTILGLVQKYHDEHAPGGRWFRLTAGSHPVLELHASDLPQPNTPPVENQNDR